MKIKFSHNNAENIQEAIYQLIAYRNYMRVFARNGISINEENNYGEKYHETCKKMGLSPETLQGRRYAGIDLAIEAFFILCGASLAFAPIIISGLDAELSFPMFASICTGGILLSVGFGYVVMTLTRTIPTIAMRIADKTEAKNPRLVVEINEAIETLQGIHKVVEFSNTLERHITNKSTATVTEVEDDRYLFVVKHEKEKTNNGNIKVNRKSKKDRLFVDNDFVKNTIQEDCIDFTWVDKKADTFAAKTKTWLLTQKEPIPRLVMDTHKTEDLELEYIYIDNGQVIRQ